MEILTRKAPIAPATWDAEARTFDAVISTGAEVQREDLDGPYVERLALDQDWPDSVPVLDAHNRWAVSDVIGNAENIRREGDNVVATIRLSSREQVAGVAKDIADGILRNISIGYRVAEWRELEEDGRRVREAVKWELVEVSLVPIPADQGAKVRGIDDMPELENRERIDAQIRELAQLAQLGGEWADEQIGREASVEDARAAAMAALEEKSKPVATVRSTGADTLDDPDFRARAMGEALYSRVDPSHEPSGPARQYAGLTVPELARETLRARGLSVTGMSASRVIERALHSTSDFPAVLGDGLGRTLRRAYEQAPSGIRMVARQTTARDFRAKHRIQLSAGSELDKVNEAGEFKRGTLEEASESYKLDTYGKVFGITRQALVNDDLGAFADLARRLGMGAAAKEAQVMVDLLVANSGAGPTMSDGVALFHADHGNLAGTGAALDETPLTDARAALRKQTGLAGEYITVTPRYLLVPAELETAGEKLLSTIQATKTGDVNPFDGLTLVVEPRLTDATAFYVIADPAQIDGLEFAYLDGEAGPQIDTRIGFDVDGVEMRVRLDFGAGFVDWRSWFKDPGAAQ